MTIERTLVQIRERTLLDLLDLSLIVVRKRPFTLGLAALLGIAPFAFMNYWLFQISEGAATFFGLTIWMLEAPLATAPLTLVLGTLMFGQKPTFRQIFGSLFKNAFGLIAIHGAMRFVVIFYIPTRLAFANAILLLERGKWWKILGRGGDLATGRDSELLAMGMLQFILTYVFALFFFIGASRIEEALLVEDLTWDLPDALSFASWRFQIPIWIVVAFFAIARFLMYIDQRIRLEGWEIELRLRGVGESIQESRRW